MSSTSNRDRLQRPTRSSTQNYRDTQSWNGRGLSNNFFENHASSNGWIEPPLREPQPSFVDNKLDRLGVLENMMPLGTNPSAKQRARARADPLRRHLGHKNLESFGLDDGRGTPDFANGSDISRAVSRAASARGDESSIKMDTPPPLPLVSTPPAPSTTFSSPATPANMPLLASQDMLPHTGELPVDPQILGEGGSPSVHQALVISPKPTPPSRTARNLPEALQGHHKSPTGNSPIVFNPAPEQVGLIAATPSAQSHSISQPAVRVLHTVTHIQPGSPFAKAIVEVKRKGLHHQVSALTYLHAASQKDNELAQLLLGESKGDLTPLMRKRLKRKIKDLKRSYKRSEPIPDFTGPGTTPSNPLGFTPGLHTSRSSTVGQSPNNTMPPTSRPDSYSPVPDQLQHLGAGDSPIVTHSHDIRPINALEAGRTNDSPMAATQSSHHALIANLGSPLNQIANELTGPASPAAEDLKQHEEDRTAKAESRTKAKEPTKREVVEDEIPHDSQRVVDSGHSSPLSPPPASEPEMTTDDNGIPPIESSKSYDPTTQNAFGGLRMTPMDESYLTINRSNESASQNGTKRSAEEAFGIEPDAHEARKRLERGMLQESHVRSLESEERPFVADRPLTPAGVQEDEVPAGAALTPNAAGDQSISQSPNAAADSPERGPTNLGRPPKRQKPQPPRTRVTETNTRRTREGLTAGIAPLGRRDREPGYLEEADYNDVCASCGSGGNLIFCAGCDTGFHALCREPPVDPKKPEAFFCNKCVDRKRGAGERPTGLFSSLFERLEEKNPRAFRLPSRIATYFEGAKVGPDGQYVSVSDPRTNKREKPAANGKEEDLHGLYREVKNKHGKKSTIPALCCSCGLSAAGKKDLLPCDYCNLAWHLDCLDPPLAKAPTRNEHNSWKCPNHIEHDLQLIDAVELNGSRHAERRFPYHRIRKPAKHLIIDTHLQRGVPNNGLIEVHFEEESEDEFDVFDQDSNGTILRLPAKGIKLDFIHKVKQENEMHAAARRAELERLEIEKQRVELRNARKIKQKLKRHTFLERRTALNLTQLSQKSDLEPRLSGDVIDGLINQLEADAPAEVVEMLSKAPKKPQTDKSNSNGISNAERKRLEILRDLIDRQLKG